MAQNDRKNNDTKGNTERLNACLITMRCTGHTKMSKDAEQAHQKVNENVCVLLDTCSFIIWMRVMLICIFAREGVVCSFRGSFFHFLFVILAHLLVTTTRILLHNSLNL